VSSGEGAAIVAVDIGTTATKAVAFRRDGQAVAHSARSHPLVAPHQNSAEQDPDQIFEAVVESLGDVTEACSERGFAVDVVACCGAMHSLLALGADGRPLTNAVTWADARAARQAARLRAGGQASEIYRRTGAPLGPMTSLAKLLWFREERPQLLRSAARWVSIKEYVLARLTGVAVVDASMASATGLFNIDRMAWDEALLSEVGLAPTQLSPIVPVTHVLPALNGETSERVGLARDTPVVVGGSDGAMSNVGLGATAPGVAGCNIGTSAALRVCTQSPLFDPYGRTFTHAVTDNLWLTGIAVNNGGAAVSWLHDLLEPTARAEAGSAGGGYEDLLKAAGEVAVGSEGLIFLPFLLGERAPQGDPDSRAVFFGLSATHGRAHLVRAVLEGVALQIGRAAALLQEVIGPFHEVRATGGLLRSAVVRRILADVLRRSVRFPSENESACLGAALVAMTALGMLGSMTQAESVVVPEESVEPSPAAALYEPLAEAFERVHVALREEFSKLAQFRSLPRAGES
jgi:gluconokinase